MLLNIQTIQQYFFRYLLFYMKPDTISILCWYWLLRWCFPRLLCLSPLCKEIIICFHWFWGISSLKKIQTSTDVSVKDLILFKPFWTADMWELLHFLLSFTNRLNQIQKYVITSIITAGQLNLSYRVVKSYFIFHPY